MKNAQKELLAIYRRERMTPFAWGVSDCLCFAADCAMALGHSDPIANLRGRYDSELGAKRVMVEEGWHDLAAVAAAMWPTIPVAQARTGDWAYIRNPDGTEAIGVVVGAHVWARTQSGLGAVPLTAATQAFRAS